MDRSEPMALEEAQRLHQDRKRAAEAVSAVVRCQLWPEVDPGRGRKVPSA